MNDYAANGLIANPYFHEDLTSKMEGSAEAEARDLLRRGIPHDAPACAYHQRLRSFPSLELSIKTTVIKEGAFFPLCYDCQTRSTTKAELDILFQRPMLPDLCLCASTTVNSDCWYCSLTFWELDKQVAVLERSKHKLREDGSATDCLMMTCGCGKVAQEPYQITKCVTCNGTATTFNRAGLAPGEIHQHLKAQSASNAALFGGAGAPTRNSGGKQADAGFKADMSSETNAGVIMTALGAHAQGLDGAIDPATQQDALSALEGPMSSGDQQIPAEQMSAIIAALGIERVRPKLSLKTHFEH
ncbi:hypothetical protein MBLNU230_g1306t1 [Neophaeotheca triangularis]